MGGVMRKESAYWYPPPSPLEQLPLLLQIFLKLFSEEKNLQDIFIQFSLGPKYICTCCCIIDVGGQVMDGYVAPAPLPCLCSYDQFTVWCVVMTSVVAV